MAESRAATVRAAMQLSCWKCIQAGRRLHKRSLRPLAVMETGKELKLKEAPSNWVVIHLLPTAIIRLFRHGWANGEDWRVGKPTIPVCGRQGLGCLELSISSMWCHKLTLKHQRGKALKNFLSDLLVGFCMQRPEGSSLLTDHQGELCLVKDSL